MHFTFNVPSVHQEPVAVELTPGTSTFFLGANGSGKTRLAAEAERQFGDKAHRISAHRSLNLNPNVPKISEQKAINSLRFGYADTKDGQGTDYRIGNRWGSRAETMLLNDFDYLLQALFADQSNISLQTHIAAHAGTIENLEFTRFQKLIAIWDRILPHRTLKVTGDDITAAKEGQPSYSAAEMSDGERSVFYMLGQVLTAMPDSVLIFDEPELHIHRSILGRLWDEIEVARPDCSFMVITHDLDFAASRNGNKYIIRSYQVPAQWDIEQVPEDTGFSEETVTLILGSRKPILFVEGTGSSLDLAIYRACYPDWTVIPKGACENVIHAVATMRSSTSLTRITCSGIVDADDYSEDEKRQLASLGVAVLPVTEIENLFLLPSIASAILDMEGFTGSEREEKLSGLFDAIIAEVNKRGSIEKAVLRYCRRRIDRTLKEVDLKDASSAEKLARFYVERTKALDVMSIAKEARERIEGAVEARDIKTLVENFDSKALIALAAKHLRGTSKGEFENWLSRAMRNPKYENFRAALKDILPALNAR